jgi:hypothetical protein
MKRSALVRFPILLQVDIDALAELLQVHTLPRLVPYAPLDRFSTRKLAAADAEPHLSATEVRESSKTCG